MFGESEKENSSAGIESRSNIIIRYIYLYICIHTYFNIYYILKSILCKATTNIIVIKNNIYVCILFILIYMHKISFQEGTIA